MALAAAGVLAAALPAQAHVTLQTRAAPVGSYYIAVLTVPHGCKGSDTVALKVQIPDGLVTVKPQVKPGWTIMTTDGQYPQPVKLHGTAIDHGVREITWRGGDLPDAYFDQFAFQGYLLPSLKPGETLYFPVVQECKQGTEHWIDTSGKPGVANPAPALKLLGHKAPGPEAH
jgi:uncharacterized protein YcnI